MNLRNNETLQIVGGHPNRRITRFSVKNLKFSIISIVDIPLNIVKLSVSKLV